MSDISGLFDEPTKVRPEVLSHFFEKNIIPVVCRLYDGNFAESTVGDSVAINIGRGALDLFLRAECLEFFDPDPTSEELPTIRRKVTMYIALLLDDEILDHLKDRYIESCSDFPSENGDPDDLEGELMGARAWDTLKICFDYDDLKLEECTRYWALESTDDITLHQIGGPKCDRDKSTLMSDELSLLQVCVDMHLTRLI